MGGGAASSESEEVGDEREGWGGEEGWWCEWRKQKVKKLCGEGD